MKFKLTGEIHEFEGAGYTGWINEMPGIVAQGQTIYDVRMELLNLIRIKYEIINRE